MARGLCPPFDLESYRAGHLTPVFFGSALNNFGVRELLRGRRRTGAAAAAAAGRAARRSMPEEDDGRRLRVQGPGQHGPAAPRPHRLRAAVLGPLPPRHEAEELAHRPAAGGAQPGALPGARPRARRGGVGRRHHRHPEPRHPADRRHADRGRDIRVTGMPSFAPELLRRVRLDDPMKQKHLGHALTQLAEEGVTRVFKPLIGSDWIIGVVGALQFDVLQARLQAEYGLANAARRRPLRGRALARRRPRRTRPLPRPQRLGARRRPRRHPRLPRPQRLGPAHHDRGMAGDPLRRDKGAALSPGQNIRGVALPRYDRETLPSRSWSGMRFEWDPTKSRSNLRKHGISFETARLVLRGCKPFVYPGSLRRRRGAMADNGLGRRHHGVDCGAHRSR